MTGFAPRDDRISSACQHSEVAWVQLCSCIGNPEAVVEGEEGRVWGGDCHHAGRGYRYSYTTHATTECRHALDIINCKSVPSKLPLATKCLRQPVMKPILPGEEVAQRSLHEIPSGSCLQFRIRKVSTLHDSSLELGSLRYSSECEKAPACGSGELALLQRRACIFAGRYVCESWSVSLYFIYLIIIHYSTLIIFTAVCGIIIIITVVSQGVCKLMA